MKKIVYFFSMLLVLATLSNAQTTNKVITKWFVQCKNVAIAQVYTDTLVEGSIRQIKAKTLPTSYLAVQPLYDALVGSEYGFDANSLNNDIEIWITLTEINCQNGLYLVDSTYNLNFFFRGNVSVIGHTGQYNLNSGTYFNLKLKRTPAFNTFMNLAGINPQTALAFAYKKAAGQGYDTTGIVTTVNDSVIWAKVSHFSDIVGAPKANLTSVNSENNIPTVYSLEQNFPNPFNPSTNITFNLPERSNVELKVYNILGKEVASLFKGVKEAGSHTVQFDASKLNSGVYIYELKTGKFTQSRKMMLIK